MAKARRQRRELLESCGLASLLRLLGGWAGSSRQARVEGPWPSHPAAGRRCSRLHAVLGAANRLRNRSLQPCTPPAPRGHRDTARPDGTADRSPRYCPGRSGLKRESRSGAPLRRRRRWARAAGGSWQRVTPHWCPRAAEERSAPARPARTTILNGVFENTSSALLVV